MNRDPVYALVACGGKHAFDSQAMAAKVAKQSRKRREGGDSTRSPYHCAHCGKWHIGSNGQNSPAHRQQAAKRRDVRHGFGEAWE